MNVIVRLNYILWIQDIMDATLLANTSDTLTSLIRGVDM